MLVPPRVMPELVCAIANASSLLELKESVTLVPSMGDLQHVVYHYLGDPQHPPPPEPGFTTYPDAWVQCYLANDYARIDPVIQRGLRSILPFEWSELKITTPEQQKLFADSQAFDLGASALSIPLCGLAGERAVFTITGRNADTFNGPIRISYIRDYQLVATYVHQRFVRLRNLVPEEHFALSQREKECLKLASESLLGKEIAHRLKLSEPVVRLYLRVARHKLGTTDTGRAVAIAKQRGLI